MLSWFSSTLLLAISSLALVVHGQDLIASLDYGTFQGSYNAPYNLSYWRKIPFAAPPVGENRFRAPQPPEPITNGTYDSDQSFDYCPQRTVCVPLLLFHIPYSNLSLSQNKPTNIQTGKWHRRLPLPRPLLASLDLHPPPTPSSRRILRRGIHRRRRILHHPTSRVSRPQRLLQQRHHLRLPQLPRERLRISPRVRNRLITNVRSQPWPPRPTSCAHMDK